MSKSILCPIDFSPASLCALELAVKEARLRGATLDLMHAWQPGTEYVRTAPPIPFAAEFPRGEIEADLSSLPMDLPPEQIRTHATEGDPRRDIVRLATAVTSDLVVMGTHARHGLADWMLGSVCEAVLRQAPCPVMICRAAETRD